MNTGRHHHHVHSWTTFVHPHNYNADGSVVIHDHGPRQHIFDDDPCNLDDCPFRIHDDDHTGTPAG